MNDTNIFNPLVDYINHQGGLSVFWLILLVVLSIFWFVLTVCWLILPFIVIYRLKAIEFETKQVVHRCHRIMDLLEWKWTAVGSRHTDRNPFK